LEIIEQQRIIRELFGFVPRLRDIYILVEVELESCFIQFYKHELHQKLHV
jgi:hypothetical protein